MTEITRVKTITEYHRTRSLPPPEHPLISVIDYSDVKLPPEFNNTRWVLDFYFISLKRNFDGKIKYGQQEYDFDEGLLFFIAPGQVFSVQRDKPASNDKSGWMLLIHPDFLWNTPLAKGIKQHDFFGYSLNEALFVSPKEETILLTVIQNIRQEYHANIDKFSQNIIISQIETLLNYSERFYNRQFITRKKSAHQILIRLEDLMEGYFSDNTLTGNGLPTVIYFADQLNLSPKYLSSMLKVLTGKTVQEFIHIKLIEKAKEKLSTSTLSIAEIAYQLGFEHPQSFSKLFKVRTEVSPLQFRRSFNQN
ncbi:MAG: helix-turn-helix transcriptional regulator [Cyclobacteriaceae bacterium]|nr:helix-turn-helix transcriptional regulator [Cyclobacteriaceae bacterium]